MKVATCIGVSTYTQSQAVNTSKKQRLHLACVQDPEDRQVQHMFSLEAKYLCKSLRSVT